MTPLSHEQYQALRRFPAIDGVRAVAALMVVAFHFDPGLRWLSGWSGVHLFFGVSGFLITTLALREEANRGRLSIRDFYVRRAFRILPVYYVVVALTFGYLAASSGVRAAVRAEPWLACLTFTTDLVPASYLVHTWTIGIEQKFYLFWPLIAFAFVAVRRVRTVVAIAGAAALLALAPTVGLFPTALHYGVILVGCVVALLMHHPRGFAVLRPLTTPVVSLLVIAGFVVLQVVLRRIEAATGQPGAIAIYAAGILLLLPALQARNVVNTLLSTAPMRWVGDRSYSLYLIQLLAGAVLTRLLGEPRYGHLFLLAVTVVALVAADLLYRFVEKPMIDLGRRFTRAHGAAADRHPALVKGSAP